MMYIYTLHFIAISHLNKLKQMTFSLSRDFGENEDRSLIYSSFMLKALHSLFESEQQMQAMRCSTRQGILLKRV